MLLEKISPFKEFQLTHQIIQFSLNGYNFLSVSFVIATKKKRKVRFLTCVGVDLRNPYFSHGQLCVLCSRVGNREKNLHISALQDQKSGAALL